MGEKDALAMQYIHIFACWLAVLTQARPSYCFCAHAEEGHSTVVQLFGLALLETTHKPYLFTGDRRYFFRCVYISFPMQEADFSSFSSRCGMGDGGSLNTRLRSI